MNGLHDALSRVRLSHHLPNFTVSQTCQIYLYERQISHAKLILLARTLAGFGECVNELIAEVEDFFERFV